MSKRAQAKSKKLKRKEFSVEEKVQYHTSRAKNGKTESQRVYSKHWLYGYNDSHSENNIIASNHELDRNKIKVKKIKDDISEKKSDLKSINFFNRTVLGSYINGLNAQISLKKAKKSRQ